MTYPSLGERHYMEQRRRAQEAAFAAQAHTARNLASRRVAVQAQDLILSERQDMTYRETAHSLGDVDIRQETPGLLFDYVIPHHFGSVLSMSVQLKASEIIKYGNTGGILFWWLNSTLDGEYWAPMNPVENSYGMLTSSSMTQMKRYYGPFTDRLSIRCAVQDRSEWSASYRMPGRWTDVELRLGIQEA